MTLLAQRTITGAQVRPNLTTDRRRRRLSTLVKRHADASRPFVVSVHKLGLPVAPTSIDVVMRGEWKDRLVGPQDIVLVTYLPQGGGGQGGSILMAIAAIALAIIVPFAIGALGAGTALATSAGSLTMLGKVVSTGIIMGSMALLSQAMKPKANKPEEAKPVYGVSGGGNLPRPGDRIPRLYGRCWTVPDLSQSPYFRYEGGEYQILHQRMTLTLGRARVHRIRVNGQIMATSDDGRTFNVRNPFSGSEVEVVNPGETSSLVPREVVSSPSVQGNELLRPSSKVGEWTGHFMVADPSILVNKIQLDISAPQGLMHTFSNSKGAQEAATDFGWHFQYRPVSTTGALEGEWKTLEVYRSSKLARQAVRWTRVFSVPQGRYAVRGKNLYDNEPFNERTSNIANALQWDALRGHIRESRTRPHVTEIALKIKSGEALGVTSFSNIEVEATGIVPVWTGSAWVEMPTNKAVWIYADVMRNTVYGGNLPDSAIDRETLKFYADTLRGYDTFDGVVRGPDSVWNVASTVLFPMRAEPVQLGRVWSLVRDDRKDTRAHVITSRQIVAGSSGLSFDLDPDNGESHYTVEYNERADPRRTIQLPDIWYGNQSLTPTRRNMFGVSSKPHAEHLTKWLAASSFFRRQTVRFQTEYDGRIYKRGDSISVETWFAHGARAAAVVGRSGDTLTLDRVVVPADGNHIVLRDRSGREWGPIPIVPDGSNQVTLNAAVRASVEATTGISLDNALALGTMEETTVLISWVETLTRRYLVKMAKPSGRDRVDIEAVIDHPAIWDILSEPVINVPDEVDGPDPTPPINLAVTERLVSDGVRIRSVATLSWLRTSGLALTHEVQYRVDYRLPLITTDDPNVVIESTATDGDWIPAGATGGTSIDIQDLPSAQVDFRVRAVYTAGNVSGWVGLDNVMMLGALRPPGDATNLTASVLGDVMTLAWTGVSDVQFSHYEVRFSPQLDGVEWGTAVPLLDRVSVPGAQVPAASGTYLVKAVTRAGVTSNNAAVVVSDVAGIAKLNVVAAYVEQPTFPGTKSSVVVNATFDGLQLDSGDDVYARADWFAPGLDWYLGTSGFYANGTYTFTETLDLGAVYTSRLTAVLDAFGLNLNTDFFAVADIYSMEDVYQSAAPSLWAVWLEYRTTNDNPAISPTWGEWKAVVISDVTARGYQFRTRLESYEPLVTPIVTRLEVSVDMPDRVAAGDDIAVPAAGLRVNFDPPFIGLQGLAITGQGMLSGDRYAITNKSELGYDIQFFNAAGTAVARTHDFVAKGYGRREA